MKKLGKVVTSRLLAGASRGYSKFARRMTCVSYSLKSIMGHHDFIPFIILTRSRTGSNLLISFLNSHPNVYAKGEVFANLGSHDPIVRLRRLFGKQPSNVRAKGFKIFYYHPLDRQSAELWQALEEMTELRVIHLIRKNILRTLVSRKIAEKRGVWTGTRFDPLGPHEDKTITFAPDELEKSFHQTEEWVERAKKQFLQHAVVEVTYEDLVSNTEATFRKVLNHLGVEFSQPSTQLERQNPENLHELIENYSDLKEHFQHTIYIKHFTD